MKCRVVRQWIITEKIMYIFQFSDDWKKNGKMIRKMEFWDKYSRVCSIFQSYHNFNLPLLLNRLICGFPNLWYFRQNGDDPFLYRLVGTWGFAPHPARWREMLDWFNSIDHDKFDPYVKGMATSDWLHMHTSMGKRHMTWEQVCAPNFFIFHYSQ